MATPSPSTRDIVLGIYAKLAAVVVFAGLDAAVKWLGASYPVAQTMFFRSVFAFVPLLAMIAAAGGLRVLASARPGLQALRCLIGLFSLFGFFWAFPRAPLVDLYAISFAAPLIMTALSVPLLGEAVGWRRWCAVLAGFAGVVVVLNPGGGDTGIVALVTLGATFMYALSMILVRLLSRTDHDLVTVALFTVVASLITGSLCAWDPATHWLAPTGWDWLWLASLGLLGGVGQIVATRAYRLAPPSVLAPFEYSAILFAFGFGYLFFAEWPGVQVWYGLPLIVGSGLYVLHRERIRARDAAAARAAGITR